MEVNIERVRKLLQMACHPTTNANEAHSAAMLMARILNSAGRGIDDLCVGGPSTQRTNRAASAKLQREYDALNREYQLAIQEKMSVQKENDILFKKNAELRSACEANEESLREAKLRIEELEFAATQRTASQHRSDTGADYMNFDIVAEKAARRCGRETWKSAVAFALGMSVKELNAWELVGVFPSHLVARINALSEEERAPSSRKRWAEHEIDRLKEVLGENDDDLTAATRLTQEFGRRIYETSVTNQRRRLFRHEGWSPYPRSARSPRSSARTVH